MELLTGKAKVDFLIKIYYQEDTNKASDESIKEKLLFHSEKWLNKQDKRFVISLIIDWLDSVGIICLVGYNSLIKKYYWNIDKMVYGTNPVETRSEATIEAIKKANEIYNQHLNK